MNGKVLIVEDDPAIRMLVRAVLEGEGFAIAEAIDGTAALPAARAARPDLILLDVGLPGLDGFGVLDLLTADADLRGVPVLMVTAWPLLAVVDALDLEVRFERSRTWSAS